MRYKKKKDGYEHRYIMGLKKGDKRIIHHKNGDKLDNNKDNLEIITKSEHNKIMKHGNKKYTKEEARERELSRKLKWWHDNKVSKGYVKEDLEEAVELKCKNCSSELPDKIEHPKYFCSYKCKEQYDRKLGTFLCKDKNGRNGRKDGCDKKDGSGRNRNKVNFKDRVLSNLNKNKIVDFSFSA